MVLRVAANLSMMFQNVELKKRYQRAAEVGFKLVEVSLPYALPASELKLEADRWHLKHVLINAPSGDWSKGFRGLAALPGHENEHSDSIKTALEYAKVLGVKKVHVMAGVHSDNQESREVFIRNIRFACQEFMPMGIMCLIEPICAAAIPNYFLSSYAQAVSLLEAIKQPNLNIMLDIFHAQQICGQLTYTIQQLAPLIGHVQVAQVPGRNEPDSEGEINFDYIFKVLQRYGSSWQIGCEYMESDHTTSAIQWPQRYGLSF